MKLCWADQVALIWCMFLVLALMALQQPGGFAVSIQPDNIVDGWLTLLLKVVVLPWLVLRAVDLVLGGPYRRNFKMYR